METPPPFYPRQKSKTNAIVWWIVGGVVLCCVLPGLFLGGAAFWGFNKIKGFGGCMFAFNDVQKGILKYAEAHHGKLPKAETWQTDVKEFYRSSMMPQKQLGPFSEPDPDGEWGCKDADGVMTGMAFNDELSGKQLKDIKDQATQILIFETEHPAKNLHEKYHQRDFSSSPIMLGQTRRGWMETPVSGPSWLIGQNGRKAPINTQSNGSGVSINVNDSTSSH